MKIAYEIIEDGLAEVARGIYQMENVEGNSQAAYEAAMSVVSVVRGMALDMLKAGRAKP